MILVDVKQGSPEWLEARRGVPTASNFHRIITAKSAKLSAQADDYACELLAERYHLGPIDELSGPATAAMRNGLATEPEARRWYEFEHGFVSQVGFCLTDDGRFGCSPDGLVGDDGLLEIKRPTGKTHIRWLVDGGLPEEHKAQCHGALIVTGREWLDFWSTVPGLPPLLVRVVHDDFTLALAECLEQFHEKLEDFWRLIGNPQVIHAPISSVIPAK